MNFFDAIKICFVKYTNFSDRASRAEYWLFSLFILIISLMLSLIDPLIAGAGSAEYIEVFAPLSTMFSIGITVPSISVTVRRLHDVNRTGWWYLIVFTIIGLVPVIYWMCKKSDEGENRFGQPSLVQVS